MQTARFLTQRRHALRWLLSGAGSLALYGCGGGSEGDPQVPELPLNATEPPASLLGATVRAALHNAPSTFTQPALLDQSAIVGAGIEFRYDDIGGAYWTADLADSTVIFAVFLGNTTNGGLTGAQRRAWRFFLPVGLSFDPFHGFPRNVSDTFPNGTIFGDGSGSGFHFLINPFEAAPNSTFSATWELDIRLIC